MPRSRSLSLLVLLPLLICAAAAQSPSSWPRATALPPGSLVPQAPFAAWPEDQAERMRQLNIRFCANLRLSLRGPAFPFADDVACVSRQLALLPTLCSAQGRSLRRPASFCFSAVNTEMRAGLNQLSDGTAATPAPTAARPQPAATRPPATAPLRLIENPLPLPRQPAPLGGPDLSAAAVFRRAHGVALVQSSAATSFGSSGGGLFDSRGNLVGITSFGIGRNSAFNFSIAGEGFWQLPPGRSTPRQASSSGEGHPPGRATVSIFQATLIT